jgi:hypothetical protein
MPREEKQCNDWWNGINPSQVVFINDRFQKSIVARKKGDKDYSKSEKQLLISLINDYSLFGATDSEVIQMLSTKIDKKISETLFYQLKKEAVKKRGESETWLDYYAKYQYIEYYRKRMEELEFVQKKLLKALIEETEKKENQQNKLLINQLSKTIAENSKAEFGFAPPLLSRIKSLITIKYDAEEKNNNDDVDNEDLRRLKILHQSTKSGIYLQLDNEETSRKCNESQRVF